MTLPSHCADTPFYERVRQCCLSPIDDAGIVDLTDELEAIDQAKTFREKFIARADIAWGGCLIVAKLVGYCVENLWGLLRNFFESLYYGDFKEAALSGIEVIVLPMKHTLYIAACCIGIFLGLWMPHRVWTELQRVGRAGLTTE